VGALLADDRVRVVGLNSLRQTVVPVETGAVAGVMDRARNRGFRVAGLPVSHAFHTPLMAAATPVLAQELSLHRFRPHGRTLISTVKGAALAPDEDLPELLCRQMTAPVRFLEALLTAANEVDLLIEVGPGRVLTDLAADSVEVPAIALDACGSSLRGLLAACGAPFVLGNSLNREALFAGRFTRHFDMNRRPTFFANPCESISSSVKPSYPQGAMAPVRPSELTAPAVGSIRAQGGMASRRPCQSESAGRRDAIPPCAPVRPAMLAGVSASGSDAWSVLREVVAQQMKLPLSAIGRDSRMLSDLHLNSITVGQLVAETARRLGARQIVDPTRFANATAGQIAEAFEELKTTVNEQTPGDGTPSGIDTWIEPFRVVLVERARAERVSNGASHILVDPESAPARRSTALQAVRPAAIRAAVAGVAMDTAGRFSTAPDSSDIPAGDWNVVAPAGHPLKAVLEEGLRGHGRGVVVCLSQCGGGAPAAECRGALAAPSTVESLLLEGAQSLGKFSGRAHLILVHHGDGAAAFARTLHHETPGVTTCVVCVPPDHPQAAEWVIAEERAGAGYTEAHYDTNGTRREPELQWLPLGERNDEFPVGAKDVVLVTGGGKGITAECALALAR